MMTPLSPHDALALLIARAGSQEALSHILGVTQPSISNWLNGARQLPAEHVIPAEHAYGVSRHDLRPDIYPREQNCDDARQAMRDRGNADRFHGIDRGTPNRVAA